MKPISPEFMTSLTPLFIASIGGIIGVAVLLSPTANDPAKWTAGMGLAGTAIAGAAGLAQSTKNQSTETLIAGTANVAQSSKSESTAPE